MAGPTQGHPAMTMGAIPIAVRNVMEIASLRSQ